MALFPLHETGVAQGSALSPLLCNYLLRDFDKQMNGRGIVCIRYIDDFILFAKDKRQAFKAFHSAQNALKALDLEAYDPNNPAEQDKADHGRTNGTVDLLGCEVSLTRVRPQRDKWKSLLTRIEEVFDDCIKALDEPAKAVLLPDGRGTSAGAIRAASNIVRGWGNTYSFCNDDRLMRDIDRLIDERLASFRSRFNHRIRSLSVENRRRALGLFLLADCKKTYWLIQLGHLQVNRYMQSDSEPTGPQDFIGNRSLCVSESWICAFRVGRRIDASTSVPKDRPLSLESSTHGTTELYRSLCRQARSQI